MYRPLVIFINFQISKNLQSKHCNFQIFSKLNSTFTFIITRGCHSYHKASCYTKYNQKVSAREYNTILLSGIYFLIMDALRIYYFHIFLIVLLWILQCNDLITNCFNLLSRWYNPTFYLCSLFAFVHFTFIFLFKKCKPYYPFQFVF